MISGVYTSDLVCISTGQSAWIKSSEFLKITMNFKNPTLNKNIIEIHEKTLNLAYFRYFLLIFLDVHSYDTYIRRTLVDLVVSKHLKRKSRI